MSQITDMLLLTNEESDSDPIQKLNAWCREHAGGQEFKQIKIDRARNETPEGLRSGGCKVFCTRVYACAGNYFPWEKLIDALPSFGWEDYWEEGTALILNDETVERWIAVHSDGGRVGRSLKEARTPEPKELTGRHVIQTEGPGWGARAYWNAPHGRWVSDPDDATVFYGAGLNFMLGALREKQPVEAIPKTHESRVR